MAEATKKPAPVVPLFEMPKFEIPKFDMPSMEVPAAFREFAEKGVAQSKEAYEKMKAAAEHDDRDPRDRLHDRQQGLDGVRPEGDRDRPRQHQRALRLRIEPLRREVGVRARRAVDRACAHAVRDRDGAVQGAGDLAQKVATETSEPIKTGVEKAMKKVA